MNMLRCSQDEPVMILNLTLLLKSNRFPGSRVVGSVLLCALMLAGAVHVQAQGPSSASAADIGIVDAREALRKKDRGRLALARTTANAVNHPLAMWVDYWELSNRLGEVQQAEVTTFSARWPGSYVEDRLRNDWLLELGKRRDWANFAAEFPRFRMNDDREVTCYALLVDQMTGKDVREAALNSWLAQRDADDGCALMAATLYGANQFTADDVWRKARFAIDASKPRAARQAAALISADAAKAVGELSDSPARFLSRSGSTRDRTSANLTALALMRMAATDPDAAAAELTQRWEKALPPNLSAWAWAMVGKQSAMKLRPEAADQFQRAARQSADGSSELDWPDETLAWKVRAALRADNGKVRWQQVMQAVNAMSPADQRDSAWVYWKARALIAIAKDSQDSSAMLALSREMMEGIAGQLNFYGALAAENLGQPVFMPARPAPIAPQERYAALQNPGLTRSLQLISLGLRNEGVREWNYSLRTMSDRELLAAAQLACDREIWDRCINTSERTRVEMDIDQRYPMPFRKDVTARAREIGLDPAYVYGLIRQESRFVTNARSSVGASGLMQVMPETARWTAKKIGLPYTPDLIADRDTNLKLGTAYLKLVLDEFGGSQALAAAAYNAGPGRPRKWRDGPVLEAAIWAENIPFTETRDYVKKVLSNGAYYAAILSGQPPSLTARLGRFVAPAGASTAAADPNLP